MVAGGAAPDRFCLMSALVDWDFAVSLGAKVAGDGPEVTAEDAAAAVAQLRAGADRSTALVRDFTGHGIGTSFHSGLVIPHFDSQHHDEEIRVGMTFTIEPMLNLGTPDWQMWDDGWTVVTADGRRSAQFEHTILITDDGNEILTLP